MSAQGDLRMLRRILADEQAALRDGTLGRLPQLSARKVALIERLSDMSRSTGDSRLLAEVARLAQRNGELIQAALSGVRDAQALLDRMRQPQVLETYARDGSRQAMGTSAATMERRA